MELRWIAAFFLVIAGWCAGSARYQKLEERCQALEDILWLLLRLEQEIGYRHASLEQLCRTLKSEKTTGILHISMKSISTLHDIRPPEWLDSEQQACFSECLAGLGQTTAEQECARLEYYRHRFEEFRENAQKQAQTAGIDRKLGLALGGMLALLVL